MTILTPFTIAAHGAGPTLNDLGSPQHRGFAREAQIWLIALGILNPPAPPSEQLTPSPSARPCVNRNSA